jgi:PIN domain nuclease of toxin-antitoxin system
MIWVLDASAAVCWLKAEVGARRVAEVLAGDDPVLIHAVNLLEVQYHFLRISHQATQGATQRLLATRAEVIRDLDDDLLARAALLKAQQTPIALGDVFGVALAEQRGATILTTDRAELQKIADAGICHVEFLR